LNSSLSEAYREVRGATAALCEPLAQEDFVIQSMPDASPTKWHLAHTSWFFEQFVLQAHAPDYRFYDDAFRFLFNSYYESVGPRHERPHRGLLSRPTVQQTFAYRAHVDEQMGRLLSRGHHSDDLSRLVTLGLHHEQQHQELLLTDIKHALSCNPLLPAYTQISGQPAASPRADLPPLKFVDFEGGVVEVGHHGEGFAFDNEGPRHRTYLQPFRLANRLVTNGEYREFIAAGGYERAELWLSDGWSTVQREQWTRPIYWDQSLQSEFTLLGSRALDPGAPVCHLSFYEADAYARFCEARLPTEFEWEHAADSANVASREPAGNFVESRQWHPVDAARARPGNGLLQLYGDVWEWTQSAYSPYPGFKAATGAVGEYNGKFMVNQLVLRGGSCATPRSHIRSTYRNFFYPTARWQFSGVRLAKDV
jgi:ergothioneine biosynthesis protein EgtB